MRFLAIPLVVISLFFSCQKRSGFDMEVVSVDTVFTDELDFRAIEPAGENKVWFSASRGLVGLIEDSAPRLASIQYDSTALHFRSIASTSEAVFVLSVASPALLYKIGYNGEEATHIELVYQESGPKVFYNSMKFWDDFEGIALGDPVDDCMSVLITRDSGNSWKKIPCEQLPKTVTGEVAFAASNSNIALFGDHAWIAMGGQKSRVMHSPDRGKTWEVYDTPIINGKAMTGIFTIDFWDENTGIIVGGDWENQDSNSRNKAITRDGGKTWELIADGSDPGFCSSVKFVPGMDGKGIVAVNSKGIYFSGNGGSEWKPIAEEGFFAIEFVNDTIAFASGRNRISRLVFRR